MSREILKKDRFYASIGKFDAGNLMRLQKTPNRILFQGKRYFLPGFFNAVLRTPVAVRTLFQFDAVKRSNCFDFRNGAVRK